MKPAPPVTRHVLVKVFCFLIGTRSAMGAGPWPVRSQGSPRAEMSVAVTALLPELATRVSLWSLIPAGTGAKVVVGPGPMRRGIENGPAFVVPDRSTMAGALLRSEERRVGEGCRSRWAPS